MGQVSCFECATCSLYAPQDDDVYLMGAARRGFVTSHSLEQQLNDSLSPSLSVSLSPSPRLGVSLSHWSDLILQHGGEEFFRDARLFEVYERVIFPLTRYTKLSYCDHCYLQGERGEGQGQGQGQGQGVRFVGIAEVFLSVSWEERFIDVWRTLKHKHLKTHQGYRDVFIFLPMFSCNFQQHISGIPSDKALETTNIELFDKYYAQYIINENSDSKDVVLIEDEASSELNKFLLSGPWILRNMIVHLHPWDKPLAFQRISVIFDIFALLLMHGHIEFVMNDESEKLAVKALRENPSAVIQSLLANISCERSVVSTVVLGDFLENDSPVGVLFQHSLENANNQQKVLKLISNTLTLEELDFEILKRYVSFIVDLLRQQRGDNIKLEEILDIELKLASAIASRSHGVSELNKSTYFVQPRSALLTEGLISSTLYYCEDIVGKDTFLTLQCVKKISDFYSLLSVNIDKAESMLTERLEDFCLRLGKDNPLSIRCQLYLAEFLLVHTLKFESAESLLLEVYNLAQRCLEENNTDSLHIIHNLLRVYRKMERYEEAEFYGMLCLKKYRRFYGSEHVATLTVLVELGLVLEELMKLEDARDLLKEAYEKNQQIRGILHPCTILTTYSLGMVYSKANNFERCQQYLYLFLMHYHIALNKSDSRIQHAILTIAKTFEYQQEYVKSIEWLRKLKLIKSSGEEQSYSSSSEPNLEQSNSSSSKSCDLDESFARSSSVKLPWSVPHFEDNDSLTDHCNNEIKRLEQLIVSKSSAYDRK